MEKNKEKRESLEVQGLGLRESTAVGLGSISGWRTKIPQATQHSQNSNNNMKKNIYMYVQLNHFSVQQKHNTVNQLCFNKINLKEKSIASSFLVCILFTLYKV